MSSFDESSVWRGQPSNQGQFRNAERSAPEASLSGNEAESILASARASAGGYRTTDLGGGWSIQGIDPFDSTGSKKTAHAIREEELRQRSYAEANVNRHIVHERAERGGVFSDEDLAKLTFYEKGIQDLAEVSKFARRVVEQHPDAASVSFERVPPRDDFPFDHEYDAVVRDSSKKVLARITDSSQRVDVREFAPTSVFGTPHIREWTHSFADQAGHLDLEKAAQFSPATIAAHMPGLRDRVEKDVDGGVITGLTPEDTAHMRDFDKHAPGAMPPAPKPPKVSFFRSLFDW